MCVCLPCVEFISLISYEFIIFIKIIYFYDLQALKVILSFLLPDIHLRLRGLHMQISKAHFLYNSPLPGTLSYNLHLPQVP